MKIRIDFTRSLSIHNNHNVYIYKAFSNALLAMRTPSIGLRLPWADISSSQGDDQVWCPRLHCIAYDPNKNEQGRDFNFIGELKENKREQLT